MHPALRPWVTFTLDVASYYYGFSPTLTSTGRTWDEQAALYDRYRRGLSKYPAAAPGRSCHNAQLRDGSISSLCWDSSVPADKRELWKQIRRAIGWHVPDDDDIHAEYPGWRDLLS